VPPVLNKPTVPPVPNKHQGGHAGAHFNYRDFCRILDKVVKTGAQQQRSKELLRYQEYFSQNEIKTGSQRQLLLEHGSSETMDVLEEEVMTQGPPDRLEDEEVVKARQSSLVREEDPGQSE